MPIRDPNPTRLRTLTDRERASERERERARESERERERARERDRARRERGGGGVKGLTKAEVGFPNHSREDGESRGARCRTRVCRQQQKQKRGKKNPSRRAEWEVHFGDVR